MSLTLIGQDVETGIHNAEHYNSVTKADGVLIRRPSRIANPVPAGLFGFAATTWLLSMYNVSTRGIHKTNIIVGMAIFSGGLTQVLAGMWEFPRGNVFSATVFMLYGSFWMSYATIFIPVFGIIDAFDTESEVTNAVGMYLIVWFIVTVLFIPPILRRHIAFTILQSTLAVTLLILSIAEFTASTRVMKAGGVFGILTGLIAFYIAESELMAAEETAFFRLPLGV